MTDGKHLTLEGLEQIVSIKAAINFGLSNQLINAFSNVKPINRPSYIPNNENLHPDWVSGFIEGDGSFFITIRSQTNHVIAFLSIGLNIRDEFLLVKIQEFFGGIGSIYSNPATKVAEWKISKLAHLISIIPHFNSYALCGYKYLNFIIWSEIITLMKAKAHLTSEGLVKIKTLKNQLNK